MKKILFILLLPLAGCDSGAVLHSIGHGGKNLGQAFTNPKTYREKVKQEYIGKECPKSFQQFKDEYFKNQVSMFEDIYRTLENDNYNAFINRLITEGIEKDGVKFVLKKQYANNNSLLSWMLCNDAITYATNVEYFLKGIEKRKNYKLGRDYGYEQYDIGKWPENSDICDSFWKEGEELNKNYVLVNSLANNIYNHAYESEKKDFYKKAGFYIGENNLLVPYMNGTDEAPLSNYLYYLNGLQVFQNIPGGFLASLRRGLGYSDKLIFVATNRQFVDSTPLDDIPVLLTGTKTYNTVWGSNKTIYAFKIIDTTPYKKFIQNYYFYPITKSADELNMNKLLNETFIFFTLKKEDKEIDGKQIPKDLFQKTNKK